MKAPKCKTCGQEHWGICGDHDRKGMLSSAAQPATIAKRPAKVPKDLPRQVAERVRDVLDSQVIAKEAKSAPVNEVPANLKRKANRHRPGYHAEYQRKRRAKKPNIADPAHK